MLSSHCICCCAQTKVMCSIKERTQQLQFAFRMKRKMIILFVCAFFFSLSLFLVFMSHSQCSFSTFPHFKSGHCSELALKVYVSPIQRTEIHFIWYSSIYGLAEHTEYVLVRSNVPYFFLASHVWKHECTHKVVYSVKRQI